MEHSINISLPVDDEGYTSFECPNCSGRFKLTPTDVAKHDLPILHCPLCGLNAEPTAFRTRDVDEVAMMHAMNIAREALNKSLRDLGRRISGTKGVKFRPGRPLQAETVPELHETPDLAVVELVCCDATAKVPPSDALACIYCPYCGTENL